MSVSSVYSNQREKQVTVGRALTNFIVDHMNQVRKEGKGKVRATSVHSNQLK